MPISTEAEWRRQQTCEAMDKEHSLDIRAAEAQHIEARAEQRRLMRRMQSERRQVNTEDTLKNVHEYRQICTQQLEQNARFAEAILRSKNEKLAGEKRRQQLRQSSTDLKHLEAKLRAAYVAKELDLQIAEKRLTEKTAKENEKLERQMQTELLEQHKKDHELEMRREALRQQQYKKELQGQMVSAEDKRHQILEEFLRDKHTIDAAVSRIHEEDVKAELERMERVNRSRQEMEDFKKGQTVWREKHRLKVDEENQRMEEYLQKQGMGEVENKRKNKEREEQRNRRSEKLAAYILAIEKEKREKNEILDIVAEGEYLAATELRVQKEIEKGLQDKIMMREVYQRQFAEKKERLEQDAREEREQHRRILEKTAEDDRIEQLTREKRRLKMMELRRDSQAALADKRVQRAEELQQLHKLEELAAGEEQQRQDMIEAERMRMLKEHASRLIGYIPQGVLRESDLTMLGPEFVEMYGSKGAGPNTKPDAPA